MADIGEIAKKINIILCNDGDDIELDHLDADDLLVELLEAVVENYELKTEDVEAINRAISDYDAIDKWYA